MPGKRPGALYVGNFDCTKLSDYEERTLWKIEDPSVIRLNDTF